MREGGDGALLFAASLGRTRIVQLLIKAGENIEIKHYSYGSTPLMRAVESGYPEVVRLLLDVGANIEIKAHDYGRAPLVHAIGNGSTNFGAVVVGRLDKGNSRE